MRKEREEGEKREREKERREDHRKCQRMNSNTIVGIAVAFLG